MIAAVRTAGRRPLRRGIAAHRRGKLADAVPIYQRALDVLGVPGPVSDDASLTKALNEQRATLAGMLIELQKVVKKPPSKAPPITKK